MTQPRLLDLFCGNGGATIGYGSAGFEIGGVDNRRQPNYPGGRFWQADAIEYLQQVTFIRETFQAIHASPPCQGYSPHVSSSSSRTAGTKGRDEARLIGVVRDALQQIGLPYVIENVVGAKHELNPNLLLCGTMFGLPITRHRLFETSVPIPQPFHPPCKGVSGRYADERGWDHRDMTMTGKGRNAGTTNRWIEISGWPTTVPATQHGLRESIPPAYTAYIGSHLIRAIQ